MTMLFMEQFLMDVSSLLMQMLLQIKIQQLGRCWGAYAAVMVMNSTLDGHISTKPFSGSSKMNVMFP